MARQHKHSVRHPLDTIGFATKSFQMDSVMSRIQSLFDKDISKTIENSKFRAGETWKTVVYPHDDYTYVGWLYPALLKNIRSKTLIIFGVCHKAKQFNLEDKIIFDSFDYWQEPYGNIKPSSLREEIIKKLPSDIFIVYDSVQQAEHSVEALLPFLQYFDRDREIISILVPYMNYDRMKTLSSVLAKAIFEVMKEKNLIWGKDFSILISSDAVHYGDKDWGGKNFAVFGADSAGYLKAVAKEHEIIDNCLIGKLTADKTRKFVDYTVREDDYREYKWTWCGRYSVPFGLLTSLELSKLNQNKLTGYFIGYSNSIDHSHVPVSDLGMGVTAPANINHWVGYAAVGWK